MNDIDDFLKKVEHAERRAVSVFLLTGKVLGIGALLLALLLMEAALVGDIWTYKFGASPVRAQTKEAEPGPQCRCHRRKKHRIKTKDPARTLPHPPQKSAAPLVCH